MMIQSTPHGNMRYQGIDAAKTAKINSYEQYPEVCKRITKATGGNKARMPYWFQFSKNGRSKEVYDKHKNFAKDNDCVMNRFARRFNDIGHISLNYAGIPPFNYQMMLTEDIHDYNTSAIHKFRSLIDMTYDYLIVLGKQSTDTTDWMTERMQGQSSKIDIVVEIIQKELESEFGSLEEIYPSITKYLFSGDQLNKNFGKRMYWLLFGDIAVRNLKENLADYTECEYCKMKIPKWVEKHMCVKSVKGFYECIDCGVLCERTNSRQCRCGDCQDKFRKISQRINKRRERQEKDGVA